MALAAVALVLELAGAVCPWRRPWSRHNRGSRKAGASSTSLARCFICFVDRFFLDLFALLAYVALQYFRLEIALMRMFGAALNVRENLQQPLHLALTSVD